MIEKSYKLIFIIYAPIAVISILLRWFGGFEVSFLFLLSISLSIASLVWGLVLGVKYVLKREEIIHSKDGDSPLPFAFRHDFLIPFVLISLVSFSSTSFLLFTDQTPFSSSNRISTERTENQKTRISFVLTLQRFNTSDRDYKFDLDLGYRLLKGIALYLRIYPEKMDEFDFSIIRHGGDFDEKFKQEVIKEVKMGTRYFVCVQSKIMVPLSEEIEHMFDTLPGNPEPIFVGTVSSSPEIRTKKNSLYRFFLRSTDEVEVLTKKVKDLDIRSASYIAIHNKFGEGGAREFKNRLDNDVEFLDGLFFEEDMDPGNLEFEVEHSNLAKKRPEAVYVIAENRQAVNALIALRTLDYRPKLFLTGGFLSEYILDHYSDVLNEFEWYIAQPFFDADNEFYEQDIIAVFVYLTTERLVNVIEATKGDHHLFDQKWGESKFPQHLDFEDLGNGDTKFKMRVLESSYFSKN